MSNSTMTLLSICIPTFNRWNFLSESLEVLLDQVIKHSQSKVEILLNDNASTDGTVEAVKKLCDKKYVDINIKVNNINIGARNNFNDVIRRAKGKYIYLLGDDDIITPNFLDVLIPLLEKEKYSIIHFNRLLGNEVCSNNRLHDGQYKGLIEELPFEGFVKRVMSSPNFISSSVFSKEIWDKGAQYDNDEYYGYEFLGREYFGALNTICLYYYMPLVLMRNPARSWSKFNFLYMMIGMSNLFRDLDKEIPGIKEIWEHRIRNTHFYDFHSQLSSISLNRELYRNHRKRIKEICNSSIEKRLVDILLYAPFPKLINKLYGKFLNLFRLLSGRMYFVRKTEF